MNFTPKTPFRVLLILYLGVLVCGLLVPVKVSVMPDAVRQAEHVLDEHATDWSIANAIQVTAGVIVAPLMLLIGVVGMFCFWRPSRYVFLAGFIWTVASPLFRPWGTWVAWVAVWLRVQMALGGAVLALAYFSPSDLFKKKGDS